MEADLDSLRQATELYKNSQQKGLTFSCNEDDIKACDIYIVTVPTPIDDFNTPNLRPLIKASETVGRAIAKGGIVIYESTTYPGCTEEDCICAEDFLYQEELEAMQQEGVLGELITVFSRDGAEKYYVQNAIADP